LKSYPEVCLEALSETTKTHTSEATCIYAALSCTENIPQAVYTVRGGL